MLNARWFAPRVSRFVARALVFAGAIVVAASFATRAPGCPVENPQPLRVLYLNSNRIVTARIGKTETVKIEKINEGTADEIPFNYLKTALLVASTLKGEAEPVVYVYHTMYGEYKDALSSAADGDTLLVFLNRSGEEGEDGYYVSDMSYGVKTLPDADLKIYTRRIDELNTIMQVKEPSQAEIVDWLVRCTEEPATRWEGAYDLWTSHYALVEAQARQADEANPEADVAVESNSDEQAAVEVADDTDSIKEAPESLRQVYYDNDGKLIQSLTDEQKNRLVQSLLNIEVLTGKDFPLLEVVKDWNDPRFVPYLLSQMRRPAGDFPYPVEELMAIVADKLGDKALIALVEEFRNHDYSSEEESVADDEASESSPDNESGDASVSEQSDKESNSTESSPAERTRKAKLEYFIALAESVAPQAVSDVPPDAPINAPSSGKP